MLLVAPVRKNNPRALNIFCGLLTLILVRSVFQIPRYFLAILYHEVALERRGGVAVTQLLKQPLRRLESCARGMCRVRRSVGARLFLLVLLFNSSVLEESKHRTHSILPGFKCLLMDDKPQMRMVHAPPLLMELPHLIDWNGRTLFYKLSAILVWRGLPIAPLSSRVRRWGSFLWRSAKLCENLLRDEVWRDLCLLFVSPVNAGDGVPIVLVHVPPTHA